MFNIELHLCLFICAFFTIGFTTAAEDHWHYPNLEADEEFPKWGGICDFGTQQSPINLSVRGALKGVFDKLKFNNYDAAQTGVSMVNNGHTIQLSQFPHQMKLEGGPLLDEYIVEQIHLHWWSEHTIDNVRYPLEVHMVHRNKRYANVTTAINHKDGICVVGILYHVSNQHNDAVEEILQHLDEVKGHDAINKPVQLKKPFTVRYLFPNVDGYFTYPGSLTTPSCAESVTWIVLHETFPITLKQIERFKEIEYDEGKQLRSNYRNIQKSNHRDVVVVLPGDSLRQRNTGNMLPLSFSAILSIVLFAQLLK